MTLKRTRESASFCIQALAPVQLSPASPLVQPACAKKKRGQLRLGSLVQTPSIHSHEVFRSRAAGLGVGGFRAQRLQPGLHHTNRDMLWKNRVGCAAFPPSRRNVLSSSSQILTCCPFCSVGEDSESHQEAVGDPSAPSEVSLSSEASKEALAFRWSSALAAAAFTSISECSWSRKDFCNCEMASPQSRVGQAGRCVCVCPSVWEFRTPASPCLPAFLPRSLPPSSSAAPGHQGPPVFWGFGRT